MTLTLKLIRAIDWVCNFVANWDWLTVLDWTGAESFNAAKTRDWKVDGKVMGETRSSSNLTWVTIEEAGHLVS